MNAFIVLVSSRAIFCRTTDLGHSDSFTYEIANHVGSDFTPNLDSNYRFPYRVAVETSVVVGTDNVAKHVANIVSKYVAGLINADNVTDNVPNLSATNDIADRFANKRFPHHTAHLITNQIKSNNVAIGFSDHIQPHCFA